MLEHHAHLLPVEVDVRLGIRDVHAVEVYAALRGLLQKVQRAQEGALAAAGGADYDDDLAALYVGADASRALTLPPL